MTKIFQKESSETRKRKSLAMMGNKNGVFNKGKRHLIETKLKISFSMMGKKNPKWKGGITSFHQAMRNSFKYKEWRIAIYERDKYTCQKCGDNRGGNLEADHIKSLSKYPKFAYRLSNGRTLCKSCHNKRTAKQRKYL